MKNLAIGLLIVSILFLGAGAAMGFIPLSRDGATCGSAFRTNTTAGYAQDLTGAIESGPDYIGTAQTDCSSALSDRKTFAWVLLVPGIIAFVTATSIAVAISKPVAAVDGTA